MRTSAEIHLTTTGLLLYVDGPACPSFTSNKSELPVCSAHRLGSELHSSVQVFASMDCTVHASAAAALLPVLPEFLSKGLY